MEKERKAKKENLSSNLKSSSNPSSIDDFSSRIKKNYTPLPDPFNQLKVAWRVFVENWQQLVLLTLIPMILTSLLAILSFFMKWISYVPFDQIEMHAKDHTIDLLGFVFLISPSIFSNFSLMIFFALLFSILGGIVYLITLIAQFIILKNNDKKLDFGFIINQSIFYLWRYLIFMFLHFLILVSGLILFIIPGIIFSIWFSFGYLVIIFDDYKPIEAFKKSKELVDGYWWAIFGRFIFWLAFSLFISLLIFLLRIISGTDYVAIISNLVSLIITPLSIVYFVVIYQDIKAVKGK